MRAEPNIVSAPKEGAFTRQLKQDLTPGERRRVRRALKQVRRQRGLRRG